MRDSSKSKTMVFQKSSGTRNEFRKCFKCFKLKRISTDSQTHVIGRRVIEELRKRLNVYRISIGLAPIDSLS